MGIHSDFSSTLAGLWKIYRDPQQRVSRYASADGRYQVFLRSLRREVPGRHIAVLVDSDPDLPAEPKQVCIQDSRAKLEDLVEAKIEEWTATSVQFSQLLSVLIHLGWRMGSRVQLVHDYSASDLAAGDRVVEVLERVLTYKEPEFIAALAMERMEEALDCVVKAGANESRARRAFMTALAISQNTSCTTRLQ